MAKREVKPTEQDTQPVWTLTDKEKIKKTLELIEDFENSGSSKHYKANAQKMRIMLSLYHIPDILLLVAM